MGGESGGVVGMLEVIESDFARLESDVDDPADEEGDESKMPPMVGDLTVEGRKVCLKSERKNFRRWQRSEAATLLTRVGRGCVGRIFARRLLLDRAARRLQEAALLFLERRRALRKAQRLAVAVFGCVG